jgi:DNA-binding NarL/FixJ family response regulator
LEKQKEPKAESQKQKTKRKKKSKIAEVYTLHQKGVSIEEIAEKMKLSQQVVRSYIWRIRNPQKYKKLLERYYEKKKKARLASNKSENSAEKV